MPKPKVGDEIWVVERQANSKWAIIPARIRYCRSESITVIWIPRGVSSNGYWIESQIPSPDIFFHSSDYFSSLEEAKQFAIKKVNEEKNKFISECDFNIEQIVNFKPTD